ncbi:MAG: copper chaperone PCu(A)C [Pseudomonadota bacterium]|nr:copper chaperone PCu(A)C [Pseudomonadota bacterium]
MRGWGAALLASAVFTAQAASAPHAEAAWARPTVAGQGSGGGYVTIVGGSAADRLVSASTPVARSVELHSMEMQGDVMRMRQIQDLPVPAGAEVAFKPGGKHLMFVGLKQPLLTGTSFPLTLRFEGAGAVTVQVKVAVQAPTESGPAPKH